MELLIIGAISALGYALRQQPIQDRTRVVKVQREPADERKIVEQRFEQAKNPYQTGVYANKHLAHGEPLLMPMFNSRNVQHKSSVTMNKLEMFTGTDSSLGGLGLRPHKTEKAPLFNPYENFVPVSFSGTGGNINYVSDQDRFIPSTKHQGVSCVQGQMDAPLDPLLNRYTPIMPHQKPSEFRNPHPATGGAAIPAIHTLDMTEKTTRVTKRNAYEQTLPNQFLNAKNQIEERPMADTEFNKVNKVYKRNAHLEYYGGPKHYAMDEYGAPCIEWTREGNQTFDYDYFGSGTRTTGPQDVLLPQHQDTRKNIGQLPSVAPSTPSILPDALTNRGISEYQNRAPKYGETRYNPDIGGQRRPTTILPAVVSPDYASRRVEQNSIMAAGHYIHPGKTQMHVTESVRGPKVGAETAMPMIEVPRAVGTADSFNTCFVIPEEKQSKPLVGHAAVAGIPKSGPKSDHITKNAECREKVLVYDPPVAPERGYAKDGNPESATFCKKTAVPQDRSVLQPVYNVANTLIPETTTIPKHCDTVNPHPPITHMQSTNVALVP